MPLLMSMGGDRNGRTEFTPYEYFKASDRYGVAERNTTAPASPTSQPSPSGVPTSTTGLLSQAKAQLAPIASKANAFVTQHPWWAIGGLVAAYVLTRRGSSDAGKYQGTVQGPVAE